MYAIDIETKDPNLKKLGDGSIRKDGKILGVGVYGNGSLSFVDDYFDINDPKLIAILKSEDDKCFHNGVYDTTWIVNGAKATLNGKIEDTMTREALIDEQQISYKLDDCCKRRGIKGKNYGDTVDKWWADNGGKGKAIENLENIPKPVVGKYCRQDSKATYELFYAQQRLITQYELQGVNDLEAGLYPMLINMKANGVRIDTSLRDELYYKYMCMASDLQRAIEEQYGLENINSATQVGEAFHRLGICSPEVTATGKESWNALVLDNIDHPLADMINDCKLYTKLCTMYLQTYFTDCAIGDHVHPTFYPTLRDIGGTITGRFSCCNPNFQNISADDRKRGGEVRALIIPEDDCIFGAFDLKQIEYTLFAHYAIGPKSDYVREQIIKGVDYHTLAQQILHWYTEEEQAAAGFESTHDARKMTKNFNFGSIYGMGLPSFKKKFKQQLLAGAKRANMSLDDYSAALRQTYFDKMAFVKPTCRGMENRVNTYGYMRSIGGRIHHKPLKGSYAIVNYVCQGGASDILKAALYRAWNDGVFKYIILHNLVHDEIDFSCPRTKAAVEAAEHLAICMTDTIKLKVPIRVDKEVGPNWASCNADNWDEWRKL